MTEIYIRTYIIMKAESEMILVLYKEERLEKIKTLCYN